MKPLTVIDPGTRFGRWIVLSGPTFYQQPNGTRRYVHLCRCDCGSEKQVLTANLTGGTSISCGCYMKEVNGGRERTHGKSGTPEHWAWIRIRSRCNDPNGPKYADYGGRGIFVAPEWDDFETFLRDVGPMPAGGAEIERIDNDGPYAPGNCRWATRKEQCNNTRRNHRITHRGETRTLTEWAEHLSMNPSTLANRITLYGWSIKRALETPVFTDHRTRNAKPR